MKQEGGENMLHKGKIEFVIMAERGNTIQEVLSTIEAIKKAHPNANIRVEVEV